MYLVPKNHTRTLSMMQSLSMGDGPYVRCARHLVIKDLVAAKSDQAAYKELAVTAFPKLERLHSVTYVLLWSNPPAS